MLDALGFNAWFCLSLHTLSGIKAIGLNSESFSCNGGEKPPQGRRAASWTKGRFQGDLILARGEMQPSLLKKIQLTGSVSRSSSADVATTWVSMGFLGSCASSNQKTEEELRRGEVLPTQILRGGIKNPVTLNSPLGSMPNMTHGLPRKKKLSGQLFTS